MATTKQRPAKAMTEFQELTHLLRKDADSAAIVALCRCLMLEQLDFDVEDGPAIPHIVDLKLALWTMATKLHAMHREIETLKRRVRREKQQTGGKPKAELLKKEPELRAGEVKTAEDIIPADFDSLGAVS